jgi:hypothetical protein
MEPYNIVALHKLSTPFVLTVMILATVALLIHYNVD